jgi:uncharacterized protein YndB with AHSA1/START domain
MSNKLKVTVTPGESTILIERLFDAPREKVFKAMTTKEIIEKWWLGPGDNIRVEELDVRDGGKWRYVQEKDGVEYGFFGVIHEVAAPERVLQTFEFTGLPERGHVSLQKMELTEVEGGKTKMTIIDSYLTAEDRDGMAASGMENGMRMTYDALDKTLAEMD